MFRPIRRIIGGMLLAVLIASPAHALKTTEIIPPTPEKRCYGTVLTPATYEKRLTRVEVSPAYQHQRQIPAIVEHQRLHVQTKEAAIAYQTYAPVYATVYEQILIEPERQIEVHHPSEYETWSEIIELEPAKTVWTPCTSKFGRDAVRSAMNTTGARQKRSASVLCRTRLPAEERIVQNTRLVRAAWTETKTVPARYKTVARQVVNRPSYAQKVVNQPEYTGISVEHELVPARFETEFVPATFQEQVRDVVVSGNELVRAEILCDQYTTRAHVRKIQTALVDRGYQIRIDGIYGPETKGAMEQFQADRRLASHHARVELAEGDPACLVCGGLFCRLGRYSWPANPSGSGDVPARSRPVRGIFERRIHAGAGDSSKDLTQNTTVARLHASQRESVTPEF